MHCQKEIQPVCVNTVISFLNDVVTGLCSEKNKEAESKQKKKAEVIEEAVIDEGPLCINMDPYLTKLRTDHGIIGAALMYEALVEKYMGPDFSDLMRALTSAISTGSVGFDKSVSDYGITIIDQTTKLAKDAHIANDVVIVFGQDVEVDSIVADAVFVFNSTIKANALFAEKNTLIASSYLDVEKIRVRGGIIHAFNIEFDSFKRDKCMIFYDEELSVETYAAHHFFESMDTTLIKKLTAAIIKASEEQNGGVSESITNTDLRWAQVAMDDGDETEEATDTLKPSRVEFYRPASDGCGMTKILNILGSAIATTTDADLACDCTSASNEQEHKTADKTEDSANEAIVLAPISELNEDEWHTIGKWSNNEISEAIARINPDTPTTGAKKVLLGKLETLIHMNENKQFIPYLRERMMIISQQKASKVNAPFEPEEQ